MFLWTFFLNQYIIKWYDEKELLPLNDTEKLIIEILNKIRPYIQRDGGDVEYLRFEDGIVYLRLLGACVGCSAADSTINDVIEQILVEEVPGVIAVEQVL